MRRADLDDTLAGFLNPARMRGEKIKVKQLNSEDVL
jgi:hypothetical protein